MDDRTIIVKAMRRAAREAPSEVGRCTRCANVGEIICPDCGGAGRIYSGEEPRDCPRVVCCPECRGWQASLPSDHCRHQPDHRLRVGHRNHGRDYSRDGLGEPRLDPCGACIDRSLAIIRRYLPRLPVDPGRVARLVSAQEEGNP